MNVATTHCGFAAVDSEGSGLSAQFCCSACHALSPLHVFSVLVNLLLPDATVIVAVTLQWGCLHDCLLWCFGGGNCGDFAAHVLQRVVTSSSFQQDLGSPDIDGGLQCQ